MWNTLPKKKFTTEDTKGTEKTRVNANYCLKISVFSVISVVKIPAKNSRFRALDVNIELGEPAR